MNHKNKLKRLLIIVISCCLLFMSAPIAQAAELAVTPTSVDYRLPYPGLLPDHPFYLSLIHI